MVCVHVLSVQPVASLSDAEAKLLDGLLANAVDAAALVVYLVQTPLSREEALELTQEEKEQREQPYKIVAPQNPKIAAGGYAFNVSELSSWSRTQSRSWRSAWLSSTETELMLAEALIVADEHGEFLEPPPAAWVAGWAAREAAAGELKSLMTIAIADRFGDRDQRKGTGDTLATFRNSNMAIGEVEVVFDESQGVIVHVEGIGSHFHFGNFAYDDPAEVVEECCRFLEDLFRRDVVVTTSRKGVKEWSFADPPRDA